MGRGNKIWVMEGGGIMKGRRNWKWDCYAHRMMGVTVGTDKNLYLYIRRVSEGLRDICVVSENGRWLGDEGTCDVIKDGGDEGVTVFNNNKRSVFRVGEWSRYER